MNYINQTTEDQRKQIIPHSIYQNYMFNAVKCAIDPIKFFKDCGFDKIEWLAARFEDFRGQPFLLHYPSIGWFKAWANGTSLFVDTFWCYTQETIKEAKIAIEIVRLTDKKEAINRRLDRKILKLTQQLEQHAANN